MKKGILKLSALFTAMFVGVVGVNAMIQTPTSAESCTVNYQAAAGEYNMNCNLKLTVTADTTNDERVSIATGDEFKIYFQLKNGTNTFNIVSNEIKITAANGWTVDGQASKVVNIKEDGSVYVTMKYTGTDTLGPNTYIFATAEYTKDDTASEECGFAYGTPLPNLICQMKTSATTGTHYYDSNGLYLGNDEDAKAAFYKDCYSCTTPDESIDGKYHGLNGQEVDEQVYKNECTKICKTENDKYYCKDGNECTKEEYQNECQPNPKSGSFIPYVGIAAGIILIGISTVMVRKQSKLRKL